MVLTRSFWTAAEFDAERDRVSIGEAVGRSARSWPDKEAVIFACQADVEQVRWTYAQIDDLSGRLATAILKLGYQPGDRVAIFATNDPHWILLEYALAKAGLPIVAVNPLYREKELEYALKASDVRAIFHSPKIGGEPVSPMIDLVASRLPRLGDILDLQDDVERLLSTTKTAGELPQVKPDDLFMIQYTSGTTGVPKSAWLPHGSIATISGNTYRRWGFGVGDKVCQGFPLFHVGGSGNSIPGSLIVGTATLPIHIFRASEALDILEQEQCTGFVGVPSMLSAMIEHESFATRNLSRLKRIIVGGAPVAVGMLERFEEHFGVEILNGYGQTESCGVSASVKPGDLPAKKIQTSGLALPGVSLKVVDAEGHILPCGQTGELCADGPGKMLRYGDEAATKQAFDDDGWLRTGDLATMDSDGYVAIVGRLKEMIIRGGENLYPLEIESYLVEHPDVAEAAVIGLPDDKYGEELCAVLRVAGGAPEDSDAIRSWCCERVSRWKIPKYITFIDEMPVTVSGKIKKHELARTMAARFLQADETQGA